MKQLNQNSIKNSPKARILVGLTFTVWVIYIIHISWLIILKLNK
jgi:hypothetical protein